MITGAIHKRKRRVPKPKEEPKKELPKKEKTKREPVKQRDTFVDNGITWKRTETGWSCYDPYWYNENLQLEFLVHSYLYYFCDTSVIPDNHYDNICSWLLRHRKEETEAYEASPYFELCKDLDESGSGFYLREEDIPQKVKEVAVRLLNQHNQPIPDKLKGVKPYEGRKNNH